MLKRTNVFLDSKDWKRLAAVVKRSAPGMTISQLIRQAISEFLDRNESKEK
jgi:hypothetical protein